MSSSGLKPIVKPVCPVCGIAMRYYARDQNIHHGQWALTEASYKHLQDANCKPPTIISFPTPIVLEGYKESA